jgi:NAD-dependent DNA ligase
LIDFAGPGRCVYQVTVGQDHTMSLKGLQELLTTAGYMEIKNGKYKKVVGSKLPKLNFYWVVPYGRFDKWTGKKGPKMKLDPEVHDALMTYVNQIVLSVDVEPPKAVGEVQPPISCTMKNVVLSGAFSNAKKQAVNAILGRWGATLQTNFDDSTLYLIEGTKPAKGKREKATDSRISIVSYKEFLQLGDVHTVNPNDKDTTEN